MAHRALVEELESALQRRGWRLGGRDRQRLEPAGFDKDDPGDRATVDLRSARRLIFEWRPHAPLEGLPTVLEIALKPTRAGTVISAEVRCGDATFGMPRAEQELGWLAAEVLAPVVLSTSPTRIASWQLDRVARRPSGRSGRSQYQAPIYHYPNFAAILERLGLTKRDRLLEVGCGGGAFLKRALRSGCRAAGLDHSFDLLAVARKQNWTAVRKGRLMLKQGDATSLPFEASSFTCAVMTGVLGFLPRPVTTFREILRTLRPGGRLIVYDGTPRMYGTPAAGPKVKGGVRLYESAELSRMARRAGFIDVRVENPDLSRIARAEGVPKDAWFLFRPEYNQILQARRSSAPTTRP